MHSYEAALAALADPTRRRIFERLRRGPAAVGEVAAGLPVSRPAVSQHLRVLKDAGLVVEHRAGTRRVYEPRRDGLAVLRRYVDALWEEALDRFKAAVESEGGEEMDDVGSPIRKSVHVQRTRAAAFARFTDGIATWWPLATHSIAREHAVAVTLEGRRGGRIVERAEDGSEHEWGRVLTWDPPRRLVFTWHPGNDPADATEVEVRFTAEGDACRVDLEHRGWDRRPDQGDVWARYVTGWDVVLGCYLMVVRPVEAEASPVGQ